MPYEFKSIEVSLPKHDADVVILFPGGKKLTIQARPSNADTRMDGTIYNGSLDIILPENAFVTNWEGDEMAAAPEGSRPNVRIAKQLVTELPGDYEV